MITFVVVAVLVMLVLYFALLWRLELGEAELIAAFSFVYWLVAALVILVAAGATDGMQEYRTFNERIACESRRMVPRRQTLSAVVVCVPAIQRQDTTTVHVDGVSR